MVWLIIDREETVVAVKFSIDIFKLTAELGGYLGPWRLGLHWLRNSPLTPLCHTYSEPSGHKD